MTRTMLPRISADLPGTGGVIKTMPQDFVVEEIPERAPSGEGAHLYLWIEKRDLDADGLLRHVAGALGVDRRDVGSAGNKDAHAVTRQWLSVPADHGGDLAQVEDDRVRILDVSRDREKLRTGRLLGNRFDILIRDVVPDAAQRAAAITARLQRDGLPSFYGPQRFGDGGVTADLGFALLRGESPPEVQRRGFLRRLALSAAQSSLFNEYLVTRMADGLFHTVLAGEVIEDRRTLTPAWVLDAAADQARYDARRVVPLGPMFGPKMRPAKKDAGRREAAVLQAADLTLDAFAAFGKLAPGTRRPIAVWLDDLTVTAGDDGLHLRCTLPPGIYATVLLAEIIGVPPGTAGEARGAKKTS